MHLRVDGEPIDHGTAWDSLAAFDLDLDPGPHVVSATAVDYAGNSADAEPFTLDVRRPGADENAALERPEGCGCAATQQRRWAWMFSLLVVVASRRRR